LTTSTQPQVLRYSALVAGLVYGVYHQSSLNSINKRTQIEQEYARKERLIEQAKAEYKKKTQPQETKTQTSGRTLQSLVDMA
jgi:F-type H+-transporting ATP synthase subunit e